MFPCGWKSRLQVFRGVAKEWAASTRWDPLHGGLDYLQVSINPLSCTSLFS
jgi:hypothetical protein